ncbi:MAG: hypothetical protein KC618_03505 [Candidatus Omnitrophica bacterium]|nr:hypothetical protein [Candidatus Omnitrophota bacterium]
MSQKVMAHTSTRADAHAPIGVMGDHTHKAGEFMTSYRYMRMDMPQNYSGSKKLSVAQVHDQFIVSPVDMQMDMHMLGMMYAPTDELTMMLMIPYVHKTMLHRRRTDDKQFRTDSRGIGDIKLSGMFSLKGWTDQNIHLNFGVSFPSGSINETDRTLLGPDRNLPYPMQLGSGTYDLLPGITYRNYTEDWSWGAQTSTVLRTHKNRHDYVLGNRYEFTTWLARKWQDWLSTSVRLDYQAWGNINGTDSRLNPVLVQTANSDLQGGQRIDLLFGVNLMGQEAKSTDHRLSFEFGFPVYQHLNGPQLGVGWQGTFGWQKAF